MQARAFSLQLLMSTQRRLSFRTTNDATTSKCRTISCGDQIADSEHIQAFDISITIARCLATGLRNLQWFDCGDGWASSESEIRKASSDRKHQEREQCPGLIVVGVPAIS